MNSSSLIVSVIALLLFLIIIYYISIPLNTSNLGTQVPTIGDIIFKEIFFIFQNISEKCSVTSIICYPMESSFSPVFFLILLSIIFLILIRFVIMRFIEFLFIKLELSNKSPDKSNKNLDWKEIVVGLIIPVAAVAIPFIINTPLLMYDIPDTASINDGILKIFIYNFGIASAKDVIASIITNNSNLQFDNFSTEPLLWVSSNHTNPQIKDAYLKIDVIPPASVTVISSKLKTFENKTQYLVHLRSNQWVGYHHLISIGFLYILVISIVAILLFGEYFVKLLNGVI